VNGTHKRTTSTNKDGDVTHIASFRSTTVMDLAETRSVLIQLEDELAGEGLDVATAEVRVSGKGFSMNGAGLVGIALVVAEKAGKA
jgi:hypothetical protein